MTDGRLVLGVRPAGMGADRALIVLRRERTTRVATRYSLDPMDAPKRVGQVIRQEQPTRVTDIVLASIEATGESKALTGHPGDPRRGVTGLRWRDTWNANSASVVEQWHG